MKMKFSGRMNKYDIRYKTDNKYGLYRHWIKSVKQKTITPSKVIHLSDTEVKYSYMY